MIGGMDEAGRGPAIGPIVFGLVILNEEQEKILQEKGVNDSKQLSKTKREAFKEIIEQTATDYATLQVSAQQIDTRRETITMNEIEVQSFRKLLEPYADQITHLQLDAADVNEERFGKQFEDLVTGEISSLHGGDGIFISVGAASILAKVQRDAEVSSLQLQMNEIDPDLPAFKSGYPAQAKPFLEAYVRKYHKLPDFCRKSWKTSQNALERFGPNQTGLDEYF